MVEAKDKSGSVTDEEESNYWAANSSKMEIHSSPGGGGGDGDGDDYDDDDGDYGDGDIYIMMSVCLFVCNEKSSLPPGSLLWPPELSITTLYNSGLVLMVLDWFFMVPFRFL